MLTLNLQIKNPFLSQALSEIFLQAGVEIKDSLQACDAILSCTPLTDTVLPATDLSVLPSPFRVTDLLSLVHNILYDQNLTFSDFELQVRERKLTNLKNQETHRLTGKECEILAFFYKRKGEEISKDDLLKNIWSYHPDVATHTLETHIYRLRQKLEENPTTPQLLLNCKDGYLFKV